MMSSIETVSEGTYRVTGQLDFSTVNELLTRLRSLIEKEDSLTLDFSALENSNSAGLGLLMELLEEAGRLNHQIVFTGLPDSLMDLASMSNVVELITGRKS